MTDRAPRDFSALAVESIDLVSQARELLAAEHTRRDRRGATTLAKSKGFTVVLTVIPAGGRLAEHAAAGPVVIIPLLGAPEFKTSAGGPAQRVPVGQTLLIGEGQKHQVEAAEDSAFLIIIGPRA